ncbi:MAG TPA: putative zinc-binding protein [Anaerolineae bacterium]|nr:putative zinc-binding protein [Anaerolineae bacterium]
MPSLPQRKVGIVACSGEEMAEGTVTRLAALKVLEELRPSDTVTICLPLFLAGGEGDRAFAKFYPTIAIDGCEKRCAARATELYSNTPAVSIVLDDVLAQRGLPRPQGLRRLTPESQPVVDALAEVIAAEVDNLMAARWSRAEGKVLEPETPAKVSSAGCACGSGIPVTRVQVNGRAVEIMALDPILEMAYNQGLRAGLARSGDRPEQGVAALPAQLMDTVRLYNTFQAEDDAYYAEAVRIAWHSYCTAKEQPNG